MPVFHIVCKSPINQIGIGSRTRRSNVPIYENDVMHLAGEGGVALLPLPLVLAGYNAV